jgi:hypothetical protein
VWRNEDAARRFHRLLDQRLRSTGRAPHVRAWLWTPTSLGSPLTQAGRQCEMELRLSYYARSR